MTTRAILQHLTFYILYSLFLLSLLLIISAGDARAGAWDFVPRYRDYSGELVLRGMMDGRETATETRTSSYQDLNFQEFLHARGSGYIYSPRLITLLSDVSIGLQQENRETDFLSYRTDNGKFGFRQDLMVLPNHPYNLHLYGRRAEEMVRGQAGGTSRALIHQWGARAQYQQRPWQTMLNYTHSESAGAWASITDTIGTNLYYFDTLTFWNINGSYNRYISSRYDDQSNTVKDVFAAHISKKWESFRCLSRWNLDQNNQEDRFQSILDRQDYSETRSHWEWFNELSADLPYNFHSNLSQRKRHSEAEHQRGDQTGGAINDTDSYNLNFRHHLYKSLISHMNNGYRTTESAGGKTEQKDASLSTNYSKLIRWGSLGAGLFGGIADTANTGGTTILSETHFLTTSSPTSFTLDSTQLDPSSINVSVIDVFNNNMVVPLIRDINYTVIFLGESYRILLLAPPLTLTEPWLDYTYIVDYANTASDFTLRGKNWGGSVRMNLFNQLFSPHAGYQRNDQQALSGLFPGALDSSTSYDVGVSSSYGNVQADLSRHWRTSTTEYETSLIAYVTASLNVTDLTGGSCAVSYENRNTEQLYASDINNSTSITINELTLDENIYAGHVQIFTSWPQWELNGTLGANYSLYQGLGESTTRSINSGLTWHIGRMDINLRLSYLASESAVMTSHTSSNYYTAWFILRRQLF